MANATTSWCNTNLNYFPHNQAITTIPTMYLAYFTVTPTTAGGGTEVTLVQVTNYARVSLTGTTTWTNAAANTLNNAVQINLVVPAGGTGASVVAWGLYDAAVGGNLLFFGPVTFAWTTGSVYVIPVGSFTISLN